MRSDKTVPIAFGTDIHCTSIVDASWSSDAQLLGLSSTDGYITLIRFEVGELGGIPDWSTFSIKVSTPPLDTNKKTFVEKERENDEFFEGWRASM
jgi:chromatin assembly factor 1 subunit B